MTLTDEANHTFCLGKFKSAVKATESKAQLLYPLFKDRGRAVRFIHDIRSHSLTWNYFIFELSTVARQSKA